MDAFGDLDRQEYQNALNDAIQAYRGQKEKEQETQAQIEKEFLQRKEEQEKKDEDYNSKLEAITEPFAQELLRRPVERLAEKAVGGVKSTVAKGFNYIIGKGKSKLEETAKNLGVNAEDLEALKTGDLAKIGQRVGQRTIGEVPTGSASQLNPATLDDDTRTVLNRVRLNDGMVAKPRPAAQELDAFTGKPITAKEPEPIELDEASDWTHQLYDQPITQVAPKSSVPDRLQIEPDELATDAEKQASQRISNIFSNTIPDNFPTPSFKPAPVEQPAEVLDQLAPMRAMMKAKEITPLEQIQNSKVLQDYYNASPDLTPEPTQVQQAAQKGGTPDSTTQPNQPESTDVSPQAKPETDKPSDDGDVDASKSAADDVGEDAGDAVEASTGADVGEAAATAAEEAAATAAEGGFNPVSDILGLALGVGTLLGGIFGGHHHEVKPPTQTQIKPSVVVNAAAQQGVY